MELRFNKWGNSLGARFPKALVEQYGIRNGTSMEISPTEEGILLRPKPDPIDKLKSLAAGLDLETLCAHITDDNRPDPEDTEWGPPVGREVW